MQPLWYVAAFAAFIVAIAFAIATDDPVVTANYARCVTVDDNGDMAQKRDACTAALRKIPAADPRVPRLFANRGLAHSDLGAHARAMKDLERAVASEPANAQFRYWHGLAYHMAGNRQSAIADYTKAIALNYDTPAAWINRAILHAEAGDFDHAIAGLERILKMRPNHVMALTNRAGVYARVGKLKEAEADVARLEEVAPTFPGTIWSRAVLHLQKREYEAAIARLDELASIAPEVGVFTARSIAHALLKAFDKARADLETAKKMSPAGKPCIDCAYAQMMFLARQRRFEEAGVVLDNASKDGGDSWRMKDMRCYIRLGEARHAEALSACNEAIKARQRPYGAYTNRAAIHLKLGDLDRALADYDTALKFGEWTGTARYGRGIVLKRKGDANASAAEIARALQQYPQIAEDFALVGLKL